jgi:hypothetical protein
MDLPEWVDVLEVIMWNKLPLGVVLPATERAGLPSCGRRSIVLSLRLKLGSVHFTEQISWDIGRWALGNRPRQENRTIQNISNVPILPSSLRRTLVYIRFLCTKKVPMTRVRSDTAWHMNLPGYLLRALDTVLGGSNSYEVATYIHC